MSGSISKPSRPVVIEDWISEDKPVQLGGQPEGILNDPKYLTFFKILLEELDIALEDLELHGCQSQQGYRRLKDWYRKMNIQTQALDQALTKSRGNHD